jgi:hypothetical protein
VAVVAREGRDREVEIKGARDLSIVLSFQRETSILETNLPSFYNF